MSVVSQALREGVAAAQAHEYERARPLLQRATTESPDDPVGWFWLAIVSSSADAAIPCLRRVLALDPAHDQARNALAKLLVAHARGRATSGDRPEARALALEAVQVTPRSPTVWLALVALTDDQVERIEALRQVADLSPEDPQIRTRLRQALLARGVMVSTTDRAEARGRFREAATLNPSDARVWLALANLADSPAELLQCLRDLLQAVPDHAGGRLAFRNALVSDAQALTAVGRADEASARWREAIEATSGDVETWLGLAETTSDPQEAERAIQAAYDLNPDDERAAAAMERLRGPQIDPGTIEAPDDAFARFTAASELDPADDSMQDFDTSMDTFAQFGAVEVPATQSPVLVDAAPIDAAAQPAPEAPAAAADSVDAPALMAEPSPLDPAEPRAEPAFLHYEPLVQPAPEHVEVVLESRSELPAREVEEPTSLDLDLLDRVDVDVPDAPPALAVEPLPVVHAETISEASASPETRPSMPAASVEPASWTAPAAAAPVEVSEPAVPPTATPATASRDTGRRTVMVVDDSPTIRKILGLTLERAGYTVLAEPDGEAALARLVEVLPDLILLDIAMPKIDGYEVCKRIKQDPRTAAVPVVMLSGKDALFDKVKGHLAGAAQYLTKPFETPAVLAVVTSYCQPAAEVVHG